MGWRRRSSAARCSSTASATPGRRAAARARRPRRCDGTRRARLGLRPPPHWGRGPQPGRARAEHRWPAVADRRRPRLPLGLLVGGLSRLRFRLRPDRDRAIDRRRRGAGQERLRRRLRGRDRRADAGHGRRPCGADRARLEPDRGAERRPDRPTGARRRAATARCAAGRWRTTSSSTRSRPGPRARRRPSSRRCSSSPPS